MFNTLSSKRTPPRFKILCTHALRRLLLKSISFFWVILLLQHNTQAQSLTLSSLGQTGTSGTNWSVAGTNPVTINVTGTASINTSVITGYLNAGTSVIVNNGSSVGTNINSNISKTAGGNATLTVKDIGCVRVNDNVGITSTSNMLNIILWSDSDSSQGGTVDDYLYCGAGSTFISNGGKIVMAGGPDNGSNGGVSGDGIPDGFSWNGSNLATYGANTVGGLNLGPRAGVGTAVSLQSDNGDIILRGSTSNNNGFPGITSQSNFKIVSGTGKITMFGKSTSGHGMELTYGGSPAIAISSAATAIPAIDIKGTTTAVGFSGFWASNNVAGNILIQSTAATNGGVTVEGTSAANTGLWLGTTGTSINSQVLSQSGTITLKGKGGANVSLVLYGDVFVGNRKDATAVQGVVPAVTASTANMLIQADDTYQFSNTLTKNTNFSSTGSLTIKAYTSGFANFIGWVGNTVIGSAFNSITLGDAAENYGVLVNNTLTAAGNITAYATNVTLGDGVGLISTVAGTISVNAKGNFNTSGAVRRMISTVNGNIDIFADADANGSGQLDIDYTTFNPGTGNTRLRAETMLWVTTNNVDRPYINGTGTFTIESSDASFQDLNTLWFMFDQDANGIAGLTLGKSTNTGAILHQIVPITVAGPIAMYGGLVSLNANITSSATGNIFIKSNTNVNTAYSINAAASILKTAGTGTLTMQSQDRLISGTIAASGTGVLNVVLWSDYDNDNNGGVEVRSITTNGGALWVGGSNSNGGSYSWNGFTVGDGPSVASVNNNYNAIDFYGPVSTNGGAVLVWGGNGVNGGISGISVFTGASITAGTGNITLIADNIALNDLTITTTGTLRLVPDGGSYPAAITWSGTVTAGVFNGTSTYDALLINNFANLAGLTIGYYNGHLLSGTPVVQANTSNITVGSTTAIAGSITLYGTGLTISQNLASMAAGNINLFANNLSVAGAATLGSTGYLSIEPITAATTIGLAGGAGTLGITAANLTTNFSNTFSEIRIGNAAAGNITLATVIATQRNLRLTTAGNLLLNETWDIGNNDLRFIGTSIVPATNKFLKTNGTGRLVMDIANGASRLFPLGTNFYNPVTVTNNTGAGDTFSATASPNVYTGGGSSGTPVAWSPRINVTWNVRNTAASTGAGNVNMTFGWNAGDTTGSLTSPRLVTHDGTSWQQLSGVPTFDLGAGTLSYTGYTGNFTPFAIAQANISLPVTWASFTGEKVQQTVVLRWITATEQNNNYFEVERSADGISYTAIGRIAAAPQTQDKPTEYRYTDYQPLKGRSFYRLKQVDLDGKSSYSTIVNMNGAEQGYHLIATPGSHQLLLSIPQGVTATTYLLVYDANGRQVLRQQLQPGQSIIQTGFLMADGVYILKVVQANQMMFTKRFIN